MCINVFTPLKFDKLLGITNFFFLLYVYKILIPISILESDHGKKNKNKKRVDNSFTFP